jgi:dephospho-CoA kinase
MQAKQESHLDNDSFLIDNDSSFGDLYNEVDRALNFFSLNLM